MNSVVGAFLSHLESLYLDMSLCQIGSLTLWHVAAEIVGGTPFYVAGNLFATKQVHIKHYGLKLGGANFC